MIFYRAAIIGIFGEVSTLMLIHNFKASFGVRVEYSFYLRCSSQAFSNMTFIVSSSLSSVRVLSKKSFAAAILSAAFASESVQIL